MAEKNVYVDPDAAGANDGTNWTDAYTSLGAAEAAEQTDLVTDDDNIIFNCRSSAGTADTTAVTFDGWTTDSTHNIQILGDNDTGIWDDSAYTLSVTSIAQITVHEDYTVIKYCQIEMPDIFSSSRACIYIDNGTGTVIEYNILRQTVATTNTRIGVRIDTYNSGDHTVSNNVIYGFNSSTSSRGIIYRGSTFTILNNTIYGCNVGIHRQYGGTATMNSNLVFDCIDDFLDIIGTISYCASDDGDGINAVTITQTASEYAALVNSAPNGIFSPTDADSELVGAGESGVDIGAISFESGLLPNKLIIPLSDNIVSFVGKKINSGVVNTLAGSAAVNNSGQDGKNGVVDLITGSAIVSKSGIDGKTGFIDLDLQVVINLLGIESQIIFSGVLNSQLMDNVFSSSGDISKVGKLSFQAENIINEIVGFKGLSGIADIKVFTDTQILAKLGIKGDIDILLDDLDVKLIEIIVSDRIFQILISTKTGQISILKPKTGQINITTQ